MLKKKPCRICGVEFSVPPKQASRAYCDSEACQEARRQKISLKEKKRYRLVKSGVQKVESRSMPDEGRRCRRCGCNCYPNYFFCQECHHYVSINHWCCDEEDADMACS